MADSSRSSLNVLCGLPRQLSAPASGCFSLFSTSLLQIYVAVITGSARGLAELNDLLEDKHIQPLVKPGNPERHMQETWQSGENPTQTQVDESEAITICWFFPPSFTGDLHRMSVTLRYNNQRKLDTWLHYAYAFYKSFRVT